MKTVLCEDRFVLGRQAAAYIAQLLREMVAEKGSARLLLSAGVSQFETHVLLMNTRDVPWGKVELFFLDSWDYIKFFHLDRKIRWTGELIPDVPENASGSYRKYIQEQVKSVHFLDKGAEEQEALCKILAEAPIDVALIGMGPMAHMVFYGEAGKAAEPCVRVDFQDPALKQQLETAWFENPCELPEYPVSISLAGLLGSRHVVVCAPAHAVSKEAVEQTVNALTEHPSFTMFTDRGEEWV